ncbi:unnamed protein product [Lampetra planeri]
MSHARSKRVKVSGRRRRPQAPPLPVLVVSTTVSLLGPPRPARGRWWRPPACCTTAAASAFIQLPLVHLRRWWRHVDDEVATGGTVKASRHGLDDILQEFESWCSSVNLELSPKVVLSEDGLVDRYGLQAVENISEGEVLFSVPRDALLSSMTTSISQVLEKEAASLKSQSGWVALIVALMYEFTCPNSRWKPYLALCPEPDQLDLPMFWPEEERKRLLRGTGVPEAVHLDLENIELEFNSVVQPFLAAHPTLFDSKQHTLNLYKRMVAFVMAYSFQEPLEEEDEDEKDPNPPIMVPMADILNHVSNHNANLEFTKDCLKMISTRPIAKGEEVYNTYGDLANWQLLHMYGFVEPHPANNNDAAEIQMTTLYKAALQVFGESRKQLVEKKWKVLCDMLLVGEEGAFVIGREGVLTEEELYAALKVLCMSEEELQDYQENEGWEEDDAADESLTNEAIVELHPMWRTLLAESIRITLAAYGPVQKEDAAMLADPVLSAKLSRRERYALNLRCGQTSILQNLLRLTEGQLMAQV